MQEVKGVEATLPAWYAIGAELVAQQFELTDKVVEREADIKAQVAFKLYFCLYELRLKPINYYLPCLLRFLFN